MHKYDIINGFIYIIRRIMKNSYKFAALAIAVAVTFGVVFSFAGNADQFTGKLALKVGEVKSKEVVNAKTVAKPAEEVKPKAEEPKKDKTTTSPFVGTGVDSAFYPIIETYLGACNDPFGSPSCVVADGYTTQDLAFGADEVVYTMRVKNTSNSMPMYMDKVHLEYFTSGLDTSVWGRTEWKIYESTAPNTVLTRGALFPSSPTKGYISFDWSYPGSLQNPVIKPGVIQAGGYQTYIVKAVVTDNAAGPSTNDYIQVRANDNFGSTPVLSGTLQDAQSVNSRFIWHDYNGNYFNEASTDLMDMYGSVPSATAQWRKKVWSAPVITTPATLDIQVDNAIHSAPYLDYVYPQLAPGTVQSRHVSLLNLTPTATVNLNEFAFSINTSLRTDEFGTQITPAMCSNSTQIIATLNEKLNSFIFQSFGTDLQTSSGNLVLYGTNYSSPNCDVDAMLTFNNFGTLTLPANVPTHLELISYFNTEALYNATGFYNDSFTFAINNATTTTIATDVATGQVLNPSQITAPGFSDFTVNVDRTVLSVYNPVTSLMPIPVLASPGGQDVVLGVYNLQNWSEESEITVDSFIFEEMINYVDSSMITGVGVYEWDGATNQIVGGPLAPFEDVGSDGQIEFQNLNLTLPPQPSTLSNINLAIVANLSSAIDSDAGFDVPQDTGVSTSDNDMQMALHSTGYTSLVPYNVSYMNGLTPPNLASCTVNTWCDGTLGYVVDIQPAQVFITRTEFLDLALASQGHTFVTTPSGCTDTAPSQDSIWSTAINLGLIYPFATATGTCNPNDYITRAEASKVMMSTSLSPNTPPIVNPTVGTFPDVVPGAWYYSYVESLYSVLGSVYAVAGQNFYPGNFLDEATASQWISNLP